MNRNKVAEKGTKMLFVRFFHWFARFNKLENENHLHSYKDLDSIKTVGEFHNAAGEIQYVQSDPNKPNQRMF